MATAGRKGDRTNLHDEARSHRRSLFVFYAKDAIIIAKIDARKMNDISDGADAAYFDCGQPLPVDS
jgi:hypothetical protein